MKSKTFRFGVISARERGAYLAQLYSEHPEAQLVAICDMDPSAFDIGQKQFPLKSNNWNRYFNIDDMLKNEKMDWVFIASGDPTHYQLGKKILNAGCNAFIEKPMCITIEEADDLWTLQQKKGLSIVVGCELRYHSAVVKFREILKGGIIGKIVMGICIATQKRGHTYFRRKYRHSSYGSPPLLQKGIHMVDLAIHFANSDPVRVFASGGRDLYGGRDECTGRLCTNCPEENNCDFHFYNGSSITERKKDINRKNPPLDAIRCVFDGTIDVNDNSILLIDFANGCRMSVAEIFFAPENKWEFFIYGTKGEAHLKIGAGPWTHKNTIDIFTSKDRKPKRIDIPAAIGGHGGADELMRDALIEGYLQGRCIPPTARDGRAGVATISKALESEETGQVMEIPWPDKIY
ncbi:MAG: Gfo/Idh/MocA family oxidoreductase [bacterium]|nr:Gfo/Idh/MocA family oxidoreductase [bacterium]